MKKKLQPKMWHYVVISFEKNLFNSIQKPVLSVDNIFKHV